MKRLSELTVLLATGTLFFSACTDPEPVRPPKRGGANVPPPRVVDNPGEGDNTEKPERPPRDRDRETEPTSAPRNNPAPPPPSAGNPEYGKPVAGKPGFVTSPYAPNQGYVDVRGFPPGTEVKDPYTGKVFLVPAQ